MTQVSKKASVYEAVDVEATEFLVSPSHQATRWRLLVGSVAAVCAVVCIGLNQIGVFASQPTRSPLAHLTSMQDNLMSAFASRALSENSDFNLAYEVTLNEEGAADPNAMSVVADMKVGDGDSSWPQMTVTFAAAAGKQDELNAKLKSILVDVVAMEKEQNGAESAKHLESLASITKASSTNGVLLIIKFPKGPAENADQKELMADFKEHHPTFHAELSFGRTIQQMFHNSNVNMVLLPHGVHAKVGAGIASTVFDMIGDSGVSREVLPMLSMMKGFSEFSSHEKMIYKHDATEFDKLPTLAKEVDDLKQAVKQGPPKLVQHLKGLDKLMTGISSITATGLPLGWEVDVKLTHFHPAPVLASMVPPED